MSAPTRRAALSQAAKTLAESGASDARLDAEWMLAQAAGTPRLSLLLALDAPLSPGEAARFSDFVKRRAAGDPLQYVLGTAEFMGHEFACDRRALIPRCDTEPLCEAVIARARKGGTRVLELGAGSGAVSVSVCLACPDALVTAVDVSEEALCLCRENGERHGARVEWLTSDWFAALEGRLFDVIFSNPPYIRTGELAGLQSEVRREPRLALDGGEDGLIFYRRTLAALSAHLETGGSLLFEAGDGEADDVRAMLRGRFEKTEIRRDLSGLPRVVIGDGYGGNAG